MRKDDKTKGRWVLLAAVALACFFALLSIYGCAGPLWQASDAQEATVETRPAITQQNIEDHMADLCERAHLRCTMGRRI